MQINAPYTLEYLSKLCTWIHIYMLFIYAKFQSNQTVHKKVTAFFASVQKEQSKPP